MSSGRRKFGLRRAMLPWRFRDLLIHLSRQSIRGPSSRTQAFAARAARGELASLRERAASPGPGPGDRWMHRFGRILGKVAEDRAWTQRYLPEDQYGRAALPGVA